MQRARTLRIVTTALVATLAIVVASPTLAAAGPAVATAEADLVAQLALDLARTTGQPLSAPDESCAAEDLVVSWVEPDATSFEVGGHITPVGPAPGAATREVSGVVLCGTSTFAYLGFEAWKTDGTWQIAAVPAVDADHGAHVTDAAVADGGAGQLRSTGTYSAATAFSWSAYGSPEPHAAYDGQTTCDPAAKPGTIKLRDFLLNRYEGSGSFGISRECSIGGQSEHKEGRAFDWAVNALSSQRTLADDFVMRATMSDANGNLHSFARRMGIMYMIWDKKMWRAYRPGNGWAAYTGASPHTDHVHISLSRRPRTMLTSASTGRTRATAQHPCGLLPPRCAAA